MIPDELINLDRWCAWRYVERNGKQTKVPINAKNGGFAKSNDESTWSTYREAVNFKGRDGIGFFFKPPYIGVDLDDCRDDIERYQKGDYENNVVYDFYEGLKSYGEISPSGNGLHIICKGKLPGNRKRKGKVEVYDHGRFFTMTGHSLRKYNHITTGTPEALNKLYNKYLENKVAPIRPTSNIGVQHNMSDSEVVRLVLSSQQGVIFQDLLKGKWEGHYTSQSEADLAMANILAFWTARDFDQMDRIFRQTGLYREKWDEKRGKTTYGVSTLSKAINDTSEVYRPKVNKEKPVYHFNFITSKEKKEFPTRTYDDTGNALRFLDRYGDIVRYSYNRKKFYVYNGEKWELDERGLVMTLIDKTVDSMKNEKIVTSDDADEEDARKVFEKHIKNSRSKSAKYNMLDLIKHQISVAPGEFDPDDMSLNVANGYVDLTSGELLPHDRNKMFSKQANAEYSDKMQPDAWMKFLSDIFDGDQQVIRYMQKAIGYSLTGSTREQVMFILHGKGRNGKSLFIETIAEILGDYSQSMRAESIMVKKNQNINNDIAALQDARFVTSTEPNEGFRFDEGLIKQLTGGDRVTARFLYGEDFEFTPKFKLWLTTNHKPLVRGTDDGIWRRLVLIPFNVQIPEDKVDKDLKFKLIREAPAILEWMTEGCRLWQREGLGLPKKIAEASQEYRSDMDVLEHFIEDCCEKGEGYTASGSELYEEYKRWADDTGEYKYNKNTFGKKMKDKIEYGKVRGIMTYKGIKIVDKYQGLSSL